MSLLASWWFNSGDDLPDYWTSIGGINTKVAPTAVITRVPVVLTAVLAEGDIHSVHIEDDTTSYQNTSGNPAYTSFSIGTSQAGGAQRHVKIYSSPTDDSATGAILLFEIGTVDTPAFDGPTDSLTVSNLKIENNHYLVVENVDESRVGDNSLKINNFGYFFVLEYTGI